MLTDNIQGSILAFWFDNWLVLGGFVVSLVLTILVINKNTWKGMDFGVNVFMILAVLAGIPLTMLRIGMEIAVTDRLLVTYISMGGAAASIIVGIPYFIYSLKRASSEGRDIDTPEFTMPQGGPFADLEAEGTFDAGFPDSGVGQRPDSATRTAGSPIENFGEAATQAPRGAWLQIKSGPMAGQTIPISGGTVTIGRSTGNDVILDDPSVSRSHAVISYRDGRYYVEDAGSMGGTVIEGTRSSSPTQIQPGASLVFGDTEMVFMESESTRAAEPSPSTRSAPPSSSTRSAPRQAANSQSPAETVIISSDKSAMVWLAVVDGPQKGKSYQLKIGSNSIGRDSSNDFVIEDRSVSRRHAMINVQGEDLILVDLGSRRGTKVGEKTLKGRKLDSGGIVAIGQTRLSLVIVEGVQVDMEGTMSGATIMERPGGSRGAVLIVQSGPDSGKSFRLEHGDNVIGRDSGCSVFLSDPTVSRNHAMIRVEDGEYTIFDLGSRTGIRVDGEGMSGYRLSPNEVVTLGNSKIALMHANAQRG